ncbi:MAG: septum formation initiator family protein [Alicyclobacillus sp.]|nr:septum formation initiator family protein [Alicyclobacillus sp.]
MLALGTGAAGSSGGERVLAKLARLTVQTEQRSDKHKMATMHAIWLRRIKLRYVLLVAVLVWAGYYEWRVEQPQLTQLQVKQQSLQSQLADLQKQHTELTRQAQQLQDDAYIARYASEHYNLSLPGQVTFEVKH